jgi:hypothetical protein
MNRFNDTAEADGNRGPVKTRQGKKESTPAGNHLISTR